MNKTVNQSHENRVSTANILHTDPRQHHHSSVMINVKKRNMTLFFLQYKENRVNEVNDFREKIVMRHDGDFNFVVVFCRVIDGLTQPTVTLAKTVIISLYEDVGTNRDLQKVVVLYYAVKFVRFPILHELWSPIQDKVEVNGENSNGFERI